MMINRQLRTIADIQHGYFTAHQAVLAGYSNQQHTYHIQAGNWLKVDRALYRLPNYPDALEADFVRWTLWAIGRSRTRLAVVSHESALFYYGLQDVRPATVHLTVSSRKEATVPAGCQLHLQTLVSEDYASPGGFKILTPAAALRTMQPDLMYERRWVGALRRACETNLLTEDGARQMLRESGQSGAREYAGPVAGWGGTALCRDACNPAGTVAGAGRFVPTDGGGGRMLTIKNRFGANVRGAGEWTPARRSFTLVEMLVVIAIMCVLAGLLLPAMNHALGTARQMSCLNNQRQITCALNQYAADWRGYFPIYYGASYGVWPTLEWANWWVSRAMLYTSEITPADATRSWGGATTTIGLWDCAENPAIRLNNGLTGNYAYGNELGWSFTPQSGAKLPAATTWKHAGTIFVTVDGGMSGLATAPTACYGNVEAGFSGRTHAGAWHNNNYVASFLDGHAASAQFRVEDLSGGGIPQLPGSGFAQWRIWNNQW